MGRCVSLRQLFVALLLVTVAMLIQSVESAYAIPVYDWAAGIGAASSDESRGIAVDAAGNVYTAGVFSGTVDFDPGPGVHNLTSVGADIFVSKHDTNGHYLWAVNMGGTGSGGSAFDIAIDSTGNVYTTGYFYGAIDFDPGPGTADLTSAGNMDIFVSKLDTNGNYVWAVNLGGTGEDRGRGIEVDGAGNVYTTGSFYGTADFDPGPGTADLFGGSDTDIFISKLDANGNYVWAGQIAGSDNGYGNDIAVDGAGNIYTTGSFRGTVDFDPGPGMQNQTSAGSYDIFISKFDTNGNYLWAWATGSTGNDGGEGITVDRAGNIYTTGDFGYTVDFDPGPGLHDLISGGGTDIFISKLDTNGNYLWAGALGGFGNDRGDVITFDSLGNIYCAGGFTNTIDADPGAGTQILTSVGGSDVFVGKFDTNGNYLWAGAMGGSMEDNSFGIAVDAAGNIYNAGMFEVTADFDPGPGTQNLTSAGGRDIFISKLVPSPEIDVQRPAGISIVNGGTDNVGSHLVGRTILTYTIDNSAGGSDLIISAGGVTVTNLVNVSGFTVVTPLPLAVPAGLSATLQLQFTIDSENPFNFDLEIANNDPDENPYNIGVSGVGTSAPPPSPGGGGSSTTASGSAKVCNISIDLTAAPSAIRGGDSVRWTGVITNPGPDDCIGATVTGTMPGEFSITRITPTRGIVGQDGQYLSIDLGTMKVGDRAEIVIETVFGGYSLPEGAAGQSAGQQFCLTEFVLSTQDTSCVTLFPDALPATGGEPVRVWNWWWLTAGMGLIGIGVWVVRQRGNKI